MTTTKKPRKPTKWALCLHLLTQRPLYSIQANRAYGDTALHSTISTLTHSYGMDFRRDPIRVRCRNGELKTFTLYTLEPSCLERAALLLKPFSFSVELPPIED